jgi:TonB family protein
MRTTIQILLTFALNAAWQVTLVVGFAAVADRMLRSVAARYRHYLWVATLFACLIIPALSCLPPVEEATTPRSLAVTVEPIPIVTSRIITPGVEDARARPLPAVSVERPGFSFPLSVRVRPWLAFTIIGLYLLIVLWRLTSLLRAWRRTNLIVAGAFECAFTDRVQALVQRCQAEAGVKAARVLCSKDIALPITVGVFDRIVILPQRFAREANEELLTSALGHEFQHIARHDYLLNLVYEFIYVPLSFHPAAVFARRRIRHTRELCCDAAVTKKLISAEVYARSLVKLIGSAPLLPLAPDTTIGMNESDILEVRIMSLLRKSQLSLRRRALLLIAAAVLLLTPCVAAARFALTVNTQQEPARAVELKRAAEERVKQERALTVELERQVTELKKQIELAPKEKRTDIEAKLRETEQSLLLQHKLEAELLVVEKERLAKVINSEDLLTSLTAKLNEAQTASKLDRKPRVINHTVAKYTDDAREKGIEGTVLLGFTVDHDGIPQGIQIKRSLYPSLDQASIEAVREWRFEPAIKNGQPVSMWMEAEMDFRLSQDPQRKEEREARERRQKEEYEKALAEYGLEKSGKAEFGGQEYKLGLQSEAARRAERQAEEKRNAILAGLAKISMDHAIQIANSKLPGKVIECSLVGEHWEGAGELAKPSLVLYHVVMLSPDATPVRSHVLINAMDGSVVKVNNEEKREPEEMTAVATRRRSIEGGVLNTRASNLPVPAYPAIARAAHAAGDVAVRVVIDEGGNVIEATAVSGHPLLRAAAYEAARGAKFSPTRVNGEPVTVTGLLVFTFVAQ